MSRKRIELSERQKDVILHAKRVLVEWESMLDASIYAIRERWPVEAGFRDELKSWIIWDIMEALERADEPDDPFAGYDLLENLMEWWQPEVEEGR